MKESLDFKLHPDASQDIIEIWEFIASNNTVAANNVSEQIFKTINLLVEFPDMGFRRPDLTSKPLRFQISGNYVIAYAPDKNPLLIVGVDTRRNPRVLASILRNRQ